MTEEARQEVREYIRELQTASHQSREKEISGLFRDINASMDRLFLENKRSHEEFLELKKTIEELQRSYTDTVIKNVNMWNSTSERQRKVEWLIISGVVTAALAFLYSQA